MIYVCRNVKDTFVSWFHHTKNCEETFRLRGTFEQAAQEFKNEQNLFGGFWKHLKVKRIGETLEKP